MSTPTTVEDYLDALPAGTSGQWARAGMAIAAGSSPNARGDRLTAARAELWKQLRAAGRLDEARALGRRVWERARERHPENGGSVYIATVAYAEALEFATLLNAAQRDALMAPARLTLLAA